MKFDNFHYLLIVKIKVKMKEKLIYKYFNDDDFLAISNAISKAEKKTSGEIRISIKEKRGFLNYSKSLKRLAEIEFYRLQMNHTRDKTGILIFILLSERKFYILADEGINNKVEQSTWDKIRDEMQTEFSRGNFTSGIIDCIKKVSNILESFFPIKADDTNELSNKVEF